ncbi:MAG TPA: GNAT family N-acetyltransferase [Anaerolineae bacterium]|nr:GNAT family N-acetyltransferase [Anaerolineae bacterium]
MDLSVRIVQPEDAEAIVNIFNPIIEAGTHTVFDTPFTVEAEREYILNFPQRGLFLAAVRTQDHRLVGFQSMEPFAGYTHAFDHVGVLGTYVDLRYRRQGIASALFKASFEAAIEKGYTKIFTFIRADNLASLATYLNQGFRIVGTAQQQARINGQFIDEIMVEKFL